MLKSTPTLQLQYTEQTLISQFQVANSQFKIEVLTPDQIADIE